MCYINSYFKIDTFSMQATHRWLAREGSGLSGKQNAGKRTQVMNFMRKLRSCTTVSNKSRMLIL